ncbi:liver-expressed antimicrobial peptide 2-like isoform X2 [Oncorhynchus nerka]|uniref:Liver-expressed antimicrobial peptide 2 n=3 Tax=Oncorhynchus TaxID=8016 RepID=H8PHI1_ONCMY|nr:liver-expressed antimicrobial peptide 2-like [Oncorhynchus mykiss]XP_024286591.1 liver-expressed antimicrobial peptide 2-like [Oncorhynchus tshawytscha]XP_029507765.1 liver-expressed antimicrobial peptide 2-like [Oncorhynchus nerka]ADN34603.1 liver-expressed antimicrobial peptide 2 isoform C [Oncorhynchus mykiss]
MRTAQYIALFMFLTLLCPIQVQTAPVPEDWTGLITRAKRSLLWRWNTLKPVGTSCREHDECGTKYCRKKICSFQVFIS